MEKRALLAIVVSLMILLGFQYFFSKPVQQPAKEQTEAVKKEEKKKEPSETRSEEAPKAVSKIIPVSSSNTKEIKIETDLYTAMLSSEGAVIKKWELKQYKDKNNASIMLAQGQPAVPALAIGSNDSFDLSKANFRVIGKDIKLDKNTNTGSVVFEYAASGYSIKRTYTFYFDTYKFDLKDEVSGLPEYWLAVGSNFGISGKEDDSHTGPILLKEAERIELKPDKLKEAITYQGRLKWIAQEDKYFFAGIAPMSQMDEVRAWQLKAPEKNTDSKEKTKDLAVIAFKGKSGAHSFVMYAGPKEHDRLKELKVGFEHIIDFGFFSLLSRPLFWLLKLFHTVIGNYGWAIVLLTIVTRIPFIPLLNKSQKSMRKMQEIQPRVTEIKEKYKKDPQRMQKEVSELFKKHKVNPVGGCLPMLLQIPVFLALYNILSIAIELRGAPFMLWIVDLSIKDPYYVLPIVMGITMIIQQKMTPSSMDPMQAKIMMFMPVIFTFMFLNFASGLVLYWLVNNILAIVQQFFANKKLALEQAEKRS